ncbi:MAG TPA: helix-turn-helix transcriptional regulator [Steroidobacteraceae bacterium]|nr:helix-turn-helix transcriptional regulator [Steroidobacteraceae bacterium]
MSSHCDDICGDIERQASNVLVFPLAGVFAKHEAPRRHFIATSNDAMFIAADRPYRISYPAGIGDECLTIRFANESSEHILPNKRTRNADLFANASRRLLSPSIMLARSLLWRKFLTNVWDPIDVEESSIALVNATLDSDNTALDRTWRSSTRNRSIERVKEAVALHPERKWTLAELSRLANVSPYHLAHLFRRDVGISVHKYVLRSRLAKSLESVLDSTTPLIMVAHDNGFASHSHFTARFRDLFGVTPKTARRNASGKNAAQMRKIVTARGGDVEVF